MPTGCCCHCRLLCSLPCTHCVGFLSFASPLPMLGSILAAWKSGFASTPWIFAIAGLQCWPQRGWLHWTSLIFSNCASFASGSRKGKQAQSRPIVRGRRLNRGWPMHDERSARLPLSTSLCLAGRPPIASERHSEPTATPKNYPIPPHTPPPPVRAPTPGKMAKPTQQPFPAAPPPWVSLSDAPPLPRPTQGARRHTGPGAVPARRRAPGPAVGGAGPGRRPAPLRDLQGWRWMPELGRREGGDEGTGVDGVDAGVGVEWVESPGGASDA